MKAYVFLFLAIISSPCFGEKPSLGFVIDTTASMSKDIKQVIAGISHLVEHHWMETTRKFSNFIVSPFNDPNIGPLTNTSDPVTLFGAVEHLRGSGGGDCPEKVVGGTMKALEYSNQNSVFLVFTDGLVKDKELIPEMKEIVKKKNIVLIIAMTGCCHLNPCPDQIYQTLAKLSHGAFYKIMKKDVHYIMHFLTTGMNRDMHKLHYPPKNFNDLLLFISEKHEEAREEAINHVAERECKLRKAKNISAAESFLIGCNRVKCTDDGFKVLEIRCDAMHGGRDCKTVHQSWACVANGKPRTCICLQDDIGALIKII